MIRIYTSFIFLLTSFTFYKAQPLTASEIDALANKAIEAFEVPGIAIGIIKDGKLIHAKGYGVKNIETNEKVDENTFFGIASNSKAFTTAALSILIEEKKLIWDDKVRKYIPEFTLYDPYVSEEFTVRDLVCHRSGLGLGAGDLMMWPDSNLHSIEDIIHGMRYLKPVSSFRSKYDYNNNLFIIAGEVIKRISGKSWDDFIEQKIMIPLGMNNSAPCLSKLKEKKNVARPHAIVDGKMKVVPVGWSETANAAGGIQTNIVELSKWVIAQLNQGKYGDNNSSQLFSEKSQQQMWSIQTPIAVRTATPYNTKFSGYGLGWVINDVNGFKQVGHTGGLAGMVTQVTLIPELNLGIIVLTNQQVGAAFTSITNCIKDGYIGLTKKDWITENAERVKKANLYASRICDSINTNLKTNPVKLSEENLKKYSGKFRDSWYGDIQISLKNGRMFFNSSKSIRMKGEMFFYNTNTFIVKWNERSFDADAFVHFIVDNAGKVTGFKVEAFSPLTDFSFDFQNLDVFKVD
ncbi:MAG: serine hydrolase [Sphingobacteriaceae bacterium]|nr:serine hydrolase [Sphingobacteriaceae bacterium]